ncbi:MAG: hypothetical protein AAF823_13460 [Planctomycetota bacterium]
MRRSYDWGYHIFVSVDLAGSTAFKAGQKVDSSPKWVSTFESFFEEFPSQVTGGYKSLEDFRHRIPANKLQVWKLVGDEVLFTARLTCPQDVLIHVLVVKDAMDQYEKNELADKPISLKATVWGAGFPVQNAIVELDLDDTTSIVDYLGPSIDLGFRLTKFADRRKIPVSLDIAKMILDVRTQELAGYGRLDHATLLFDGAVPLKGVIGGVSYPIIWIDRLNGQQTTLDRLEQRVRACDSDTLSEFVQEFYSSHGRSLISPFIVNEGELAYGIIPPDLDASRQKLIAENPHVSYEASISDQAVQQTDTPPKNLPPIQIEGDITSIDDAMQSGE